VSLACLLKFHAGMPRAGKFVLNHLTQTSPVCCSRKAATQTVMVAVVVESGCMSWSPRTFDCLQKH